MERRNFSGTNQKPERRRPFGTGLVRHCPQGLFSPFFTFLRAIFFRPFRLSLAPTICPWVSEDECLSEWLRMRKKKLLTGFHLVFEKFLLQKNICLYPETVLRNRQIKSAPYNNIVNHDYTKILKSDWLSTVLIYNHAMRSSDFVNHSYDYRPNWTPLIPIIISNNRLITEHLVQHSR